MFKKRDQQLLVEAYQRILHGYKIFNERSFNDNHVAIAILGAPASGKSFTVQKIKTLAASSGVARLDRALSTDVDLTVDKLRGKFQSNTAKEQLIGFYKAFNYMRQLSQESPQEYSKWFDEIKQTWIKIDDVVEEITTSIDQKNNLIFNNATNESDVIAAINSLTDSATNQAIKYLDQYKDYKRVVRWLQNQTQEEASAKSSDIIYDEAGDEPQKIIQRFSKLRSSKTPYITCAFLIHSDNPVTNLIQNAGRMAIGNDGGRDSSGSIIQAWTDIQNGLQLYYNSAENIVSINNNENEIKSVFESLKKTNTSDNTSEKAIDLLVILKTEPPVNAYERTVQKISQQSGELGVKFFNAILVYAAYYLPGLNEDTKQTLLNLAGKQVNKGNLKQVFTEVVNSHKFDFKLNNLQKMYSAVGGSSQIQEKNHYTKYKNISFKRFFTENSEQSDITVYCDMDGVLADFISGSKKYTPNFKNEWHKLPPDFFLHLGKLAGADKLMNFLRSKFKNVYILSAAPKKHRGEISARAAADKREWMNTNFKFNTDNIIIGTRQEKQQYARNNKNNILIDDLSENIKEWEASGGTGILYTDADSAIEKLTEIYTRKIK